MSSPRLDRRWWSVLPAAMLMLALCAQSVLAVNCDDASAPRADCDGVFASMPVPLVLDGRLSDPLALPPPVSSPVLDASLAELRQQQAAIALRMRLLEFQAPARSRPDPMSTVDMPVPHDSGLWARLPRTDAARQYPETYAEGLIALLITAWVACVLLLLIRYGLRRRIKRELAAEQALYEPMATTPEWSRDVDFDLKPYVFGDRR